MKNEDLYKLAEKYVRRGYFDWDEYQWNLKFTEAQEQKKQFNEPYPKQKSLEELSFDGTDVFSAYLAGYWMAQKEMKRNNN